MDFDAIVIGGGHAGIEASLALARLGKRTLLVTQDPETIGRMSCNPAIGGLSKGNLVREVDALGGQMGLLIDATMIQYRLLNRSRGPAVQAPRAQADKSEYSRLARKALEGQDSLSVFMDTVTGFMLSDSRDSLGRPKVEGVITERGHRIGSGAVVLTTGTFMEARVFIGEWRASSGRLGEPAALGLGTWLRENGFPVGRLKTGTPARVKSRSVDLDALELQEADLPSRPFSFRNDAVDRPSLPCHVTYTTEATHAIIRANIHRSPLYSGDIVGRGPRYCPSIEDKVVRFPGRDRHQIFVEPEGLHTDELYLNGLSSSLPEDVQADFIRTLPGFPRAEIVRPGYAVEYDYLDPLGLLASLESRRVAGLFVAGQTNGTSGYEEAAAQGIVAGINAAIALDGGEPLVLSRAEAYIGVLVDDLVTLGTKEPYRMFTSRAERRLSLRHDGADARLTPIALRLGLADGIRRERFGRKLEGLDAIRSLVRARKLAKPDLSVDAALVPHEGESLSVALRDPRVAALDPLMLVPALADYPAEWVESVILDARYEGYVAKEARMAARFEKLEKARIPLDFDYAAIPGISSESIEKLSAARPLSLGQASRISGVRPSDVALLAIRLGSGAKRGRSQDPECM